MKTSIAALCLLLSLSATLNPHPYHVTIAEAELNTKTKKLEVALKLRPEDLERALSARLQKKINIEKHPKIDALITAYLQSCLTFKDKKGKAQKLSWVGKELNLKSLWLYFEIPMPNGLQALKIENKLLFKVLPDQLNTMNFKDGKTRCSLTFSRKHKTRTVALKIPKAKNKKAAKSPKKTN
jgi:hypothetical protein